MRRATALAVPVLGYLGLSPSISSQFSLEMCTTAKNSKKNINTLYFEGSRSLKVIVLDTIKKLVTSAS